LRAARALFNVVRMTSLEERRHAMGGSEDALRAEITLLRGTVAALRSARRPKLAPVQPIVRVVPFTWIVWSVAAIILAIFFAAQYVVARCFG
jgi:hypothetical protein